METGMFTKTQKKINTKGFSLVELVTVTSIIGVLAAVALPQFASYRTKSYNSATISDLRNAKNVLEAYYEDYQCYP
jgi:type IV pilus assembly protein PilA